VRVRYCVREHIFCAKRCADTGWSQDLHVPSRRGRSVAAVVAEPRCLLSSNDSSRYRDGRLATRFRLHGTRVRPTFAQLLCRGASCVGRCREACTRSLAQLAGDTPERRYNLAPAYWWRGHIAAAATGVAACHLLIHRPPSASTSPLGAGHGRHSRLVRLAVFNSVGALARRPEGALWRDAPRH
jgi:hypothetical protein